MPRFDGTGPLGCGRIRGRGYGPCRNTAYASRRDPAAASPVKGASPAPEAYLDEQYGLGHGGIPCGCGRGFGRGGRSRRVIS